MIELAEGEKQRSVSIIRTDSGSYWSFSGAPLNAYRLTYLDTKHLSSQENLTALSLPAAIN